MNMNTENNSDPKRHYKQLANAIVDLVNATTNPLTQRPEGSPIYNSAVISWGGRKIELEKDRREDLVCAYMFKLPPNTRISWDEIYEEIEGMKGQKFDKEKWRKIYDAQESINKKSDRAFGAKIFNWENKALERLY